MCQEETSSGTIRSTKVIPEYRRSENSSLFWRHLHQVDKACAFGFAKCVYLDGESFGLYPSLCAHFLRIAIGDQTGHLVE